MAKDQWFPQSHKRILETRSASFLIQPRYEEKKRDTTLFRRVKTWLIAFGRSETNQNSIFSYSQNTPLSRFSWQFPWTRENTYCTEIYEASVRLVNSREGNAITFTMTTIRGNNPWKSKYCYNTQTNRFMCGRKKTWKIKHQRVLFFVQVFYEYTF